MYLVVVLVMVGVEMDVLGFIYLEYSDIEWEEVVCVYLCMLYFKEDII